MLFLYVLITYKHRPLFMKLFSKILFFLLLIAPPVSAVESTFTNHQELKSKVHAYLTNQLSNDDVEFSINVQNIDQRLKLKSCPEEVEIKAMKDLIKAGRNTVSVRCNSDVSWRIFMTAQVKIFGQVLVYRHPLNKGHLIREGDINLKKVELSTLRATYLSNTKLAINHVLKRNVNRGAVISVNNLSKPILIKKGDTIVILAESNGFKISMKAIALSSGSKGDKIRAKNIKTKKIVQGIIFDAQTIKINL